ncbi:MAG: hypothetical protein RIR11_2554 [Bacteroidota bacterium]|jgi:hypothetical protein
MHRLKPITAILILLKGIKCIPSQKYHLFAALYQHTINYYINFALK